MRWLRYAWMMSAFAVVLAACGRPSGLPPPRPGAPGAWPAWVGACGVQIFRTPACQGALDAACCLFETECARDPRCAQLSQCIHQCKATSAGQGADACMNNCGMQTGFGEPARKWALIADCSKNVQYPQGAVCNDGS